MSNGFRLAIALLAASALTACESTSRTEEDFGNSVRNMVAKQAMDSRGPPRKGILVTTRGTNKAQLSPQSHTALQPP